MPFLLLTQILLWVIITFILYRLLTEVIPKQYFTLLGGLFLFSIIALAFFFPNDGLVSAAWNVISFPLKPLGAAIVLLIIALRNGLAKSQNLVVTAMVILLISSMPFFANLLAQRSEIVGAQTEATAQAQTTGAIVLLGRGSSLPFGAQTQLDNTGDLVFYTAQLYQASGNQPLVIVSPGRSFDQQGNPDQAVEANDIATLLAQVGVPRSRIVTEPSGKDLRGRAREIQSILQEQGLEGTTVTVVSPGFGSRIASQAFSDAGINVIAQPTGFFGSRPVAINRLPSPVSFVPSVEALTVSTRVVEEFLTSIYYTLRGSLSGNPGNLG